MRYLKNLLRTLAYIGITIIISTFIITIFSYFNLLGDNIIKTIKLAIPVISVLIGGIMMGRRTNKKGIIEGIRFGLIIDIIFIIMSIILNNFKGQSLLFYLIIIISTIFGALMGVQKKESIN